MHFCRKIEDDHDDSVGQLPLYDSAMWSFHASLRTALSQDNVARRPYCKILLAKGEFSSDAGLALSLLKRGNQYRLSLFTLLQEGPISVVDAHDHKVKVVYGSSDQNQVFEPVCFSAEILAETLEKSADFSSKSVESLLIDWVIQQYEQWPTNLTTMINKKHVQQQLMDRVTSAHKDALGYVFDYEFWATDQYLGSLLIGGEAVEITCINYDTDKEIREGRKYPYHEIAHVAQTFFRIGCNRFKIRMTSHNLRLTNIPIKQSQEDRKTAARVKQHNPFIGVHRQAKWRNFICKLQRFIGGVPLDELYEAQPKERFSWILPIMIRLPMFFRGYIRRSANNLQIKKSVSFLQRNLSTQLELVYRLAYLQPPQPRELNDQVKTIKEFRRKLDLHLSQRGQLISTQRKLISHFARIRRKMLVTGWNSFKQLYMNSPNPRRLNLENIYTGGTNSHVIILRIGHQVTSDMLLSLHGNNTLFRPVTPINQAVNFRPIRQSPESPWACA